MKNSPKHHNYSKKQIKKTQKVPPYKYYFYEKNEISPWKEKYQKCVIRVKKTTKPGYDYEYDVLSASFKPDTNPFHISKEIIREWKDNGYLKRIKPSEVEAYKIITRLS